MHLLHCANIVQRAITAWLCICFYGENSTSRQCRTWVEEKRYKDTERAMYVFWEKINFFLSLRFLKNIF